MFFYLLYNQLIRNLESIDQAVWTRNKQFINNNKKIPNISNIYKQLKESKYFDIVRYMLMLYYVVYKLTIVNINVL